MSSLEQIRWCFCVKFIKLVFILKIRIIRRHSRIFSIIWLTLTINLLLGFGEADISTAVQGALAQPSSPLTLGCHRRLYTYRITQADENGKAFVHHEFFFQSKFTNNM